MSDQRVGTNWRVWCPITKTECTARIPEACLCREIPPYVLEHMHRSHLTPEGGE